MMDGLPCFRQIDQRAALDGLHDDGRLTEFAADLQALAGLDGRIVPVDVIELNLHNLNLRILGQDLIQDVRLIVEGDAEMADLALRQQLQRRFIRADFLVLTEAVLVLCVHQVIIEIINAAGCQLCIEQRTHVLRIRNKVAGELIGQDVAFTGIAAGQAVAQGRFALAAEVAVRRVEIVEAVCKERVYHPAGQLLVHLAVLHGQAHTAKAKFLHLKCLLLCMMQSL